MKFLIVTITILAWVGMIAGMAALAATEGTVTATVTAAVISISVTDGGVTYGSVALGATDNTIAESETQVVENTSNIEAEFNIKGTDSANWALVDGPSGEEYQHSFATSGLVWTKLTTTYQTLIALLAQDATESLDLEILMSADTAQEATQDVDVWVQVATP